MRRALLLLAFSCSTSLVTAKDIREDGAKYMGPEGTMINYDGNLRYMYGGDPAGGLDIRYGTDRRFVTYAGLKYGQWIYCTATEFGLDPAPGVDKYCWSVAHQTSPTAPPPPVAASDAFSSVPAPVPPTGTGAGYMVGGYCYRSPEKALAAAMGTGQGVSWQGPTSTDSGAVLADEIRYVVRFNGQDFTDARGVRLPIVHCEPKDIETYMPTVSAWFLALVGVVCIRSVYKIFWKSHEAL